MDFIRKDSKKRFTLGPVLIPDVEDLQGDIVSRDEIEKALWDFAKRLQQGEAGLNDMHTSGPWDSDLGDIVEIYAMPVDAEINNRLCKRGTWMLGVQWSPEMFEKIEKGERVGFSIEGTGHRKEL